MPVILVLIVIAIAIAALVSVGRAMLGGDQPANAPADTSRDALLNTAQGHSVRMTVRGPIVADENFRTHRITIDASTRSLTMYSGYLAQPLQTSQLGNSVKSYDEFVHALEKANLAKGAALTGDKDDTRGICATGKVYEFEIVQNDQPVKRLWTSTCKGSVGSLKASVSQLESLFNGQIPDSQKLIGKSSQNTLY